MTNTDATLAAATVTNYGAGTTVASVTISLPRSADLAAAEGVVELVFRNMSQRAAEMLREDMEAMPAVKLSDVETVQFEIVQIARKLEEEGKIMIASGGDSA